MKNITLLGTFIVCSIWSYKLEAMGSCPSGTLPIDTTNSAYAVNLKAIAPNHVITARYNPVDNTATFCELNIPPLKNVKKDVIGAQNPGYQLIGTVKIKDVNGVVQSYSLWNPTPAQSLVNLAQSKTNSQKVADVLFNPTTKQKDGTLTSNPYPTASLNQQAAQSLLSSMGADATLITKYQQFYFYLEYATRVDLAARMAVLAPQKKIDMVSTIEKSWAEFIKSMVTAYGSWQNLENACFTQVTQPDYQNLAGSIQAQTWQELITTEFWKSMPISLTTVKNSTFWQDYLKYMICYTFDQDQLLLLSIKQIEQKLFTYIPNIEVAYNQKDFTTLRHSSEIFHTRLIINDALRLRLLQDVTDWAPLKDAQGNYDFVKIHASAQAFTKSDFYTIATYAQNHSSAVIENATQSTDQQNTTQTPLTNLLKNVTQALFFQESLSLLAMIKSLQALTHPLFDQTHLAKSMQALGANGAKPYPSIILYGPEDEVFLDDINQIQANITQKATQPLQTVRNLKFTVKPTTTTTYTIPRAHTQGWIGDAWNDIKDVADDIGEGIESVAKALYHGAGMAFNSMVHILSSLSPEQALKLLAKSTELEDEIIKGVVTAANDTADFADFIVKEAESGVNTAVSGMEYAAKAVANGIDDACNFVISVATKDKFEDKKLCDDTAGIFRQTAEMTIDRLAEMSKLAISGVGGMVQLTEDAVHACAKITADVMTGQFKNLGDDIVSGLKNVAMDIATTILTRINLVFQYFTAQLIACLKLVQYMISLTVRIFIDAVTAITFVTTDLLAQLGVPMDPYAIAQTTDSWLSQHEGVIGSIITTVLLVATVPFTDGMSLGLLAMTVGPQLFDVYGSFQQDQLIADQKHDEQDFVQTFSKYVDNNKIIYQQQQNDWAQEFNLKFQSQLSNQGRGLGFYQNFMSTSVDGYKAYYGNILGSYWSNILKPSDDYHMVYADVGSLYGISTDIYNLNPSQGFALYSNARNSFSQEIAVAPALLPQSGSSTDPILSKNWFNQKETAVLANDIQEMEIRLRVMYTLPEFHVGLYFGGQNIDIPTIIKSQMAPLDPGYLAVMAVYKKETGQTQPTFGLYQHENPTQPWIAETINAPALTLGTWYHIKMQVNGTSCNIKVWAESQIEPSSWSTFTINQTPAANIIGVVSSGAAVEYQYIKPVITDTVNPDLRDKTILCQVAPCRSTSNQTTLQPEAKQEITTRDVLKAWQNPVVGKFSLAPADPAMILRSKYIYVTKDTKLTDAQGNSINDYVVACEIQSNNVSNYGKLPETNSDGIASLITNKVFSNDGKPAIVATDLLSVFLNQYGPLPDALTQTITQERQAYIQNALSATWGVFKLKAYSAEAFTSNIYIYAMNAVDQNGKPILDANKKPIPDYLVFVQICGDPEDTQCDPSDGLSDSSRLGLPYNATQTEPNQKNIALLSLVSGNFYADKNTFNPTNSYDQSSAMSIYTSGFPQGFPDTINNVINADAQAYATATTPPQSPLKAKGKAETIQPTKANAVVVPPVPQGPADSNPSKPVKPAAKSLLLRAKNAAAGQKPL